MEHLWAYATILIVAAAAGGAAMYYTGFGLPQPTMQLTVAETGIHRMGTIPMYGVHVTANYGGHSVTLATDATGQAVFTLPANTNIVLTDDLVGSRAITTGSSDMSTTMYHVWYA